MDISKPAKKLDAFQQRHIIFSFPLAIVKKYGEDRGGYLAALLTYYGFLSLFPLLLILVTILQLWFRNDPTVKNEVSTSVGHFFPLLGNQLQTQIHGMRSAGLGLVVGVVITLYGARGAADALRYAMDNMWQIPLHKRVGFPKNIIHSLAIMAAGAAGFAATAAVSSFTAALGHSTWAKVLANVLGFIVLMLMYGYMFRIATSGRVRYRFMLVGAAIAGLCIQLLLSFGSILLKHQLGHLDSVYGTFAVVLGLLFWIYLIAQIMVFSAEIDTVRHFSLYPRSISGQLQTDADRDAHTLFAKTDKYAKKEFLPIPIKKQN